jgi:hypothetical protein
MLLVLPPESPVLDGNASTALNLVMRWNLYSVRKKINREAVSLHG